MVSRRLTFIFLITFLAFGALLRLTDLTDEPLDFNPTRQLRAAVIARGIYFAGRTDIDPKVQQTAVNFRESMPLYEPPILETLVAAGYRLVGGENFAVPRVVNTLFWITGAIVLFLLGRQMASGWAILPGLAFYLFLPFSVYVSRSFQPEASMVMWVILALYGFYQWGKSPTWKWAILTGLFAGIAALVKIVAAFFIAPLAVAAVLWQPERTPAQNFRAALRNPQVWAMGVLMILPSAWYYLFAIPQSSAEYVDAWTLLGEWTSIISPSFYIRWMLLLESNFGLTLVFLGLLGAFLAKPYERALLLALWVGYALHGVYFPRQTPTHDYYHVMLLPLVALSLVPLAQIVIDRLQSQAWWVKTAPVLMLLLVSFYGGWIARSVLLGQSYTHIPAYWQEVRDALPPGRAVGYTQDFGLQMMYYGSRRIFLLPQKLTVEKFSADPEKGDYFIITAYNQIDDKFVDYLDDHYPTVARGDGYVIYNLKP